MDHRVDLVRIADPEDDDVAHLADSAGVDRDCRAGGARSFALLLAEVAGRDLIAMLDQVLEHGEPHAPDPDDADPIFFWRPP